MTHELHDSFTYSDEAFLLVCIQNYQEEWINDINGGGNDMVSETASKRNVMLHLFLYSRKVFQGISVHR
jgi:hypothetical protein